MNLAHLPTKHIKRDHLPAYGIDLIRAALAAGITDKDAIRDYCEHRHRTARATITKAARNGGFAAKHHFAGVKKAC